MMKDNWLWLLLGIGVAVGAVVTYFAIYKPASLPAPQRVTYQPMSYLNKETWEWEDRRGRTRKLTIARDAKWG